MLMSPEEILFYSGIAIMVLAILLAVVAILVLKSRKRRLAKQLEEEFGERQHEIHR